MLDSAPTPDDRQSGPFGVLAAVPHRPGRRVNHTVVRYGSHHGQRADLWRPMCDREVPVVVLIHGGFWRQLYTKRLMHGLARVMLDQGWAAYNIEYRRVGPFGQGGWPETFEDVSDAIDALADLEGIDRSRIVTCGHSAGGHLALWAGSCENHGRPGANWLPDCSPSCGGLACRGDRSGPCRTSRPRERSRRGVDGCEPRPEP